MKKEILRKRYGWLLFEPDNPMFKTDMRHELHPYYGTEFPNRNFYIEEAEQRILLEDGSFIEAEDECFLSYSEEEPSGYEMDVNINLVEKDYSGKIKPIFYLKLEDVLFLIIDELRENFLHLSGQSFDVDRRKDFHVGTVTSEDLENYNFNFKVFYSTNSKLNGNVKEIRCSHKFKVEYLATNIVRVFGMIEGREGKAYLLVK